MSGEIDKLRRLSNSIQDIQRQANNSHKTNSMNHFSYYRPNSSSNYFPFIIFMILVAYYAILLIIYNFCKETKYRVDDRTEISETIVSSHE